jgi:hypothetical protein
MKRGMASPVHGMRRMRSFVAEVTGNTPAELELAAFTEATLHLPGRDLEVSDIYSFRTRHLTIRECMTGETDPVEQGHALQAQITVYELVPEVEA